MSEGCGLLSVLTVPEASRGLNSRNLSLCPGHFGKLACLAVLSSEVALVW